MLISIIVAMDQRGLIGDEAGLPWHLPTDLRRFRAITWGKPIIMGRRTFELIGRPLPGRSSIVLSQNPAYSAPGCRVARTFQEALSVARTCLAGGGADEVMIVGGGKVYAEAIACWDRLYLTIVHGRFKGTTFFPIREFLQQKWRPASASETCSPDGKNKYGHSFHIIERAWDLERQPGQGERADLGQPTADLDRALDGLDLAAVLDRGNLDSWGVRLS
jgi:dihydrofolate reductase